MAFDARKILAREGMIILGCAVWAVVLFFISQSIPKEAPQYRYRCVTGGHAYKLTISNRILGYTPEVRNALFDTIKKNYPDDFRKNVSGFPVPEDFKVESHGQVYSYKGNVKNVTLILSFVALFLLYPLYLGTRFIFWAIRTLRRT